MNKKILSFLLIATLLICNFILPTIGSAQTITEPKVVFSLSEAKALGDGEQVELTLTVYNFNFNVIQLTLGYDTNKVVAANKNNNNPLENYAGVHTVLAMPIHDNEDFEKEGWYADLGGGVDNTNGSIKFGFMADKESRGALNGSNNDGFVETDENGMDVLKLHFKKLDDIEFDTFKILTDKDPGGNPANDTGLAMVTDQGDVTDASYVVFDLGIAPPADETPPVITLLGEEEITVTQGDAFVDPGVTVVDDVDGVLTADVSYTKDGATVSGIDTNVLGTYIISYDAEDAAGNKAVTVTRTVKVVKSLESPAKISVGSAADKQGETVTVSVTAEDVEDIYGYDLVISYDPDLFDSVTVKNILGDVKENKVANGEILVAAGSNQKLVYVDKLFDIEFEIKEDAEPGTVVLKVEEAKVSINEAEDTIDVKSNATGGEIEIATKAPGYGDVNSDGSVDAADVTLVLQHLVKITTLSADQILMADVNDSGGIDISDALLIYRYFMEDIDVFPVER